MKSQIIISLVFLIFSFSCGESPKENRISEKDGQEVTLKDHESEAIELDVGQKWELEANMRIYIRTMESDLATFKGTTLADYQTLSGSLKKNIDLLTANCTMTGKSHDELHKWLLPYIDLVKGLSEAKDETEAARQLENIQISLNTYNQYFL